MAKTPLQHHADAGHHVVPTRVYVIVLVLLALFMVLTIAASYVDLGAPWINNVVAMLIASVKAGLVMVYFMGLRWSSALARLWAGAGFIAFILMFIILLDYTTRAFEPSPSWTGRPESALPRSFNPDGNRAKPDPVDNNFRPRG